MPSWWRRAPTHPSLFPRRPAAVLLDVGGVLQLPQPALIKAALAGIHDVDATRVDLAHYTAVAAMRAPPSSPFTYLELYARALHVPEGALRDAVVALTGAFADGVRLWTRVPSSVAPGLRALADTGVRLGIVSNADGTVEKRLREQGVVQVGPGRGVSVEVVVDSTRVGVEKPDPRIFAHALRGLRGVDARAVWYLGDVVPVDVAGARAAGLVPILYDPFGVHEAAGVASVGSLRELASLVRIATARARP